MSFWGMLDTVLLGPLKLIFEFLYEWTNKYVQNPGVAIIFLSLFVNLLVLPLYKRADAIQEEAREAEAKLRDGVSHIKKYFTGDERMMILQTYYRQNNYKPTDGLKSSLSLLLQIPFFITAYQFLSDLGTLKEVSFGPISNLSVPDGMLSIGGVAINCLPILMTLVNIVSGAIYSKGHPLKTKIQLYGTALFFLVFLYNSPSGLVFYWTLNNVFSLVKTIFYKLKNPRKALMILSSCVGALVLIISGIEYRVDWSGKKRFWLILGLVLLIPLLVNVIKTKVKWKVTLPKFVKDEKPNSKHFFVGTLFLAVLIGLLIPSTYIAASPQEYVDISCYLNPLWYIVSAVCLASGMFLIWMRVFYWLASPRGKAIFEKTVWIMCGCMIVNYMFFGTKLGVLSSTLQYESGMEFPIIEKILNPIVLIGVGYGMYVIATKWSRLGTTVLLTAVLAFGFMSGTYIFKINKSIKEIERTAALDLVEFNLSKTGQNVIVFMLDRGIGEYVPYLMNERPELKEQFAGFTYYSNTISYGAYTNFGSPALLGGYEYTPVEMNKRNEESLQSKQNEANLVMPVLFAQNGYDVTVSDPIYTNYEWIPDLSIYEKESIKATYDIELESDIDAYIAKGKFNDPEMKQYHVEKNHRNFFCFSLMKTMPIFAQPTLYNRGTYNQAATTSTLKYSAHVRQGILKSTGIGKEYMDGYSTMCNLTNITKITEDGTNTFLFMSNKMTHDPILLQEPSYTPAEKVDNSAIYQGEQERFTLDGKTMTMKTEHQVIHYQANMAAFIELGKWFDYMRENGVYDNTKIILVADHGRGLKHFDFLKYDGSEDVNKNVEYYFPLLMVKDFGSQEFTTSTEFMTNADVVTLATQGLIENPVNPFTGNAINNSEKTAHEQYIIVSEHWDVSKNNGNTYLPAMWASVKDNLWDLNNWTFYEEEIVLDQHSMPAVE